MNFVNLTLTKQGNLRQSHQRISLSFSKFLLPGRSSHKPVHFDPTQTVKQKRQAKQQEQWSSQSNKIKEQKILRVRHLAMYAHSESKPSRKQTKANRLVGLMFSKFQCINDAYAFPFFPPQLSRCLPNRDQAGFRWSVPLDVTRGAPWVRLVPQI